MTARRRRRRRSGLGGLDWEFVGGLVIAALAVAAIIALLLVNAADQGATDPTVLTP